MIGNSLFRYFVKVSCDYKLIPTWTGKLVVTWFSQKVETDYLQLYLRWRYVTSPPTHGFILILEGFILILVNFANKNIWTVFDTKNVLKNKKMFYCELDDTSESKVFANTVFFDVGLGHRARSWGNLSVRVVSVCSHQKIVFNYFNIKITLKILNNILTIFFLTFGLF